MKLFLLDLWADLREKRLWPVAVLLVAGLLAVPLVVAKPAREPQPQGPDPAQQADLLPEDGVEVLAAKDDVGAGSALDLFDPKDPFRPPQAIIDAKKEGTGEGAAAGGGGGAAKGEAGGSTGESPSGGTIGEGGAPAPVAPAPDKPSVKTEQYAYVVDLFFRAGEGRTRHIKSFRRLGFLPSEQNPLLLFLGVSQDLNNAVFLVDSTLEAHGEGSCRPGGDKCSLLYLGAGELHYFTEDDGDTYALQIDQIRRVKVSGRASAKGSTKESSGTSSKESSSTKPQARRSFVPPILSDLVSVATRKRAR